MTEHKDKTAFIMVAHDGRYLFCTFLPTSYHNSLSTNAVLQRYKHLYNLQKKITLNVLHLSGNSSIHNKHLSDKVLLSPQ